MQNKILGLDLGTTSVGWALIQTGDDDGKILGGGVRIFQGVTEEKTGALKNQKRREKRAQRRNIQRRSRRKTALKKALTVAGLLPNDVLDPHKAPKVLNQIHPDPYLLRSKALSTKLSDYELGRAILNLGMRRGFLSNRKAGNDTDSKHVQPAIDKLTQEIEDTGCASLGDYLANQPTKRGRYTHRSMFEKELNSIWAAQSQHNPKLTSELKSKIEHYLLFQNPLKIQKFLVGQCALETSKKRAAKWQPIAQRFRIWQDVSRIRFTHTGMPLDWAQQKKLVDALESKPKLSWKAVRKLIELPDDTKFNLEESGALKELKGNDTNVKLTKALSNFNESLSPEKKSKILDWLDTSDTDEFLIRKLKKGFNFDEKTITALTKCKLASGYLHLSVKACNKIVDAFETSKLPLSYREAAEKAGYNLNELKDSENFPNRLPLPPKLRNPTVEKTLSETRKVVNAIIRKFGKPDRIHLEIARDLKNPKRVREEIHKHNREQEKLRENAKKVLEKDFACFNRAEPKKEDVEKYLLWKECCENGSSQCPYTGTVISGDMLFTNQVQIEHIIPYSRSLDNSFKNKTLCIAEENARKGNKTPYELYHGTDQYEKVMERIAHLPYAKRQKFKIKELPHNPDPQRLLNDTRYICKEAKSYLQLLGIRVQVSTGQLTAGLRRKWNLNGLLNEDNSNTKNRTDHRHHFVDAFVVANTSSGIINLISRISANERTKRQTTSGLFGLKSELLEPWQNFKLDLRTKIDYMVVSHAPNRKIAGALHEETALGKVSSNGKMMFATRISLDTNVTLKKVERIADPEVKKLVINRIQQFENNPKKAFVDLESYPLFHVDGKTRIKRVRLHTNDSIESLAERKQNGVAYAYYRKGNNYTVIIYELPDGSWQAEYFTAFDAASGIIKKREIDTGKRIILELCKNDMVELETNGIKQYYRLQKFSPPNNSLIFRLHTTTITSDKSRETLVASTPSGLQSKQIKKIIVSPIGEVCYVGKKNS
ncbi:MAG: type II CRISPR RNA-guided endonuclease Cas9 [Verrucomicrobiota bacterium]